MGSSYDSIFKKFVKNDDDIVGLFAYSLFEKDKDLHLNNLKAENIDIEEAENQFVYSIISDHKKIKEYQEKAEKVTEQFINDKADTERKIILTKITNDIKTNFFWPFIAFIILLIVEIGLLICYLKQIQVSSPDFSCSFKNNVEMIFYILEKTLPRISILLCGFFCIGLTTKLLLGIYQNYINSLNVLANRLYIEGYNIDIMNMDDMIISLKDYIFMNTIPKKGNRLLTKEDIASVKSRTTKNEVDTK